LKKILFRKSMEERFTEKMIEWLGYAEQHQAEQTKKLFRREEEEEETAIDVH